MRRLAEAMDSGRLEDAQEAFAEFGPILRRLAEAAPPDLEPGSEETDEAYLARILPAVVDHFLRLQGGGMDETLRALAASGRGPHDVIYSALLMSPPDERVIDSWAKAIEPAVGRQLDRRAQSGLQALSSAETKGDRLKEVLPGELFSAYHGPRTASQGARSLADVVVEPDFLARFTIRDFLDRMARLVTGRLRRAESLEDHERRLGLSHARPAGNPVEDQVVSNHSRDHLLAEAQLTPREEQVARLAGQEVMGKEIARQLRMTPPRVSQLWTSAKEKLRRAALRGNAAP